MQTESLRKVWGWLASVLLACTQLLNMQCALSQVHSANADSDSGQVKTVPNLNVGRNRTLVIDFGKSSTFNITDILRVTDGAKIYAISTNPAVHTATIRANNLFNGASGLITTVLPVGGLSGFGNLIPGLSLNLIVTHNLVNHGTVSSSGTISVVAGEQLSNSDRTSTMQAVNNLNLFSPDIVNQGIFASLSSGVNVNSSLALDATLSAVMQETELANIIGNSTKIDSTGGCISGTQGQINIGGGFKKQLLTRLIGGDYFSQQLNIDTGNGILNGRLGKLTGILNLTAKTVSIGASTPTLNLGKLNVFGGRVSYFNSTGDLKINATTKFPDFTIDGIYTGGSDLALLAAGDIVMTKGQINTSPQQSNDNPAPGNGTDGGNLIVIAGGDIRASEDGSSVSVKDSSATGGSIDLSKANFVSTISSTGMPIKPGKGGDILFVAFDGDSVNCKNTAGKINLDIEHGVAATSNSGGLNGNITIISGARAKPDRERSIILPTAQSICAGTLTIAQAIPEGSAIIKSGTLTAGGIRVGTLQNVPFGKNGSALFSFQLMAERLRFATAGDVFFSSNYLLNLGASKFGNNFSIKTNGPIYVFDDIVGNNQSSTTLLMSLNYADAAAVAPYPSSGVFRVGSAKLIAPKVAISEPPCNAPPKQLPFIPQRITRFTYGTNGGIVLDPAPEPRESDTCGDIFLKVKNKAINR